MEILSRMASENPLKRSLDGAQDDITTTFTPSYPSQTVMTPPTIDTPDSKGQSMPPTFQREPSPALSCSTLSSLPTSAAGSAPGQSATPGTAAGTAGPPAKKRKLTVQEKEQKRLEKEAKDKEKEEKRVLKEAENAAKEEDRRLKAEKRRQEAEIKEEKQRAKDLAKKQKEEEDAKKQRAQLRLGSFFARATPTKPANSSPVKVYDDSPSAPPESSADAPDSPSLSRSREAVLKIQHHDYVHYFLPFALPTNATLAPKRWSGTSQPALRFGDSLQETAGQPVESIRSLLGFTSAPRRVHLPRRAVDIIERLQGSPTRPIDLTSDSGPSQGDASTDLLNVEIKHIHFGEDVRPPYVGSYTKVASPRQAAKAARNPFYHIRHDTNYDYDSEAEWEEPEEGEDVDSDGEEDLESTGSADEMDGFVDDGDVDEDIKARRRFITTESAPISSGLCWEDTTNGSRQLHASSQDVDLATMRLQWLLDSPIRSIDPLSDSYWLPKIAPSLPAPPTAAQTDLFGRPVNSPLAAAKSEMKPPRAPLQPATTVNAKVIVNARSGEKGPIMAISTTKAPKAPAQMLTGAAFDEFKEAVDGSNLTKIELLKALKQRFPQFTNATLQETLVGNFARHGPTNADKRWKSVSA